MAAEMNTTDPKVAQLRGSSPPGGAMPSFEPVATAEENRPREAASAVPTAALIDPVFAAIEHHRHARLVYDAAVTRGSKLEGPIPTDVLAEIDLRSDDEDAAFGELIATSPATVPSFIAWTAYLAERFVQQGDEQAAQMALRAVAEAAERLLPASRLQIGPEHDNRLAELGARLMRLFPLVQEAYDERCRLEALRDNSLPPMPPALMADPDNRFSEDVEYFTIYSGGDRFYAAGAIERLRAIPRTKLVDEPFPGEDYEFIRRRVPDDEAQARVPAIVAAFEAWDEACKRHSAEVGYDAAERRHKDLKQQLDATFSEIEAVVPVTLRGLAVQADAMILHPEGRELQCLVSDRLNEFAAAVSSPVIAGVAPGSDDGCLALFDTWVATVREADDAEAAGGATDVVTALRDLARIARLELLETKPVSLQGVMLKAMTCNGSHELKRLLERDFSERKATLDTICRAVTLDLVEMAEIVPAEWPVGLARQQDARLTPDRRALEAYATWLFYERRMLLIEIYGEDQARRMEQSRYENAGGTFHFPRAGSWRDVPKPSTRAAQWLDQLGIDWRSDKANDRSEYVERGLQIFGKVA